MKYKIKNIQVQYGKDGDLRTKEYVAIESRWAWGENHIGFFATEKEAAEFIEERIRLEKQYS